MKLTTLAVTTIGLLGCAGFAIAGPAAPESVPSAPPVPSGHGGLFDEFGADLSFGYDSNYMFRGVDFGENLVWTGLDVGIPLNDAVELNVGAWYASLADTAYTELDLYAGLSTEIAGFDVGVVYNYYYFPLDDADAQEVGVSIGRSLGPVDLGVAAYYDFETEGWYGEVSAESEIALCDNVSLVPGVQVGYGDSYYGITGGNHVGVSLAMPMQLTGSATLTPYVAGNIPIDDLEATGQDSQVFGGVSLSISF